MNHQGILAAADARPPRAGLPLVYTGRTGEVARLALAIGFLGLITVTFYRFWGKTRLRRYLWSRVSVDGVPLEYTGRGSELFVGFLFALAVLIPFFAAYSALRLLVLTQGDMAEGIFQAAYVALIYWLVGVALWRARRYRLTRTAWRGIRCGQTGSAVGYATRMFLYAALAVVTLGLAVPLRNVRLYRYELGHTWFGDRSFACDAAVWPLMKRWLLAWVLLVPTLGLAWFWYKARETRHLVGATAIESVRFRSAIRGRQLLGLYAVYSFAMVAVIVVIGGAVAAPFVGLVIEAAAGGGPPPQPPTHLVPFLVAGALLLFLVLSILPAIFLVHRGLALVCRTLSIEGAPNYAAFAQSERTTPGFGEGLADALGAGGI
jgi:uncharacterized membrane protein YjgN (DUF898 family)